MMAVGSTLISTYGQWKASESQADAQRQQAELGLLRAEEILARNEINNNLIQESALSFTGTQKAQMAGSGVSVGGETSRRLVVETMKTAAKQITLNNRAAEWEARMARLGAESQMSSANQIETAGQISAAGNLGFGLFSTYNSRPADTSPKPKFNKD